MKLPVLARNGIKNMYNIPITIANIFIELTSPLTPPNWASKCGWGFFRRSGRKAPGGVALRWVESQAHQPHRVN